MKRAYGLEIPQTLEEACHPAQLALIVYDVQVGILRQLGNVAELEAGNAACHRLAGLRAEGVCHSRRFCNLCGTALAERQAASGLVERKVVSVLFCDLVGFTAASEGADPEDVRARIRPYHARLRSEIEGYGGTVERRSSSWARSRSPSRGRRSSRQ
jgi:hypothetical protein